MDVRLSEAERIFIIHGVDQNMRNDGRKRQSFRPLIVKTSLLRNTSGSCRVRLGNTEVLIGIKVEIGIPTLNCPNIGKIEFFVDCSANATPEFQGKGGDDIAQDVNFALTAVFNNQLALDLKKLCILPQHFCWQLHIDVVVLEYGGNLYDACAFATKAALFDVRIPNASFSCNEKNEPELEITDDFYDCWRLDVCSVPLIVTVNKIGTHDVVDCTLEEELCALSRLVVAVTDDGKITYVHQEGRGSLEIESVDEMIELALVCGRNLNHILLQKLQTESD